MIRKKDGFTLIELLAVIVILAILALIAIPIVIQIIKDSRENSYKRSIEAYGRNVENAMASWQTENDSEAPMKLSSYNIKMSGDKVRCDDDTITAGANESIILHQCYVLDNKGKRKSDLYKYENRKAVKEGEIEEKEDNKEEIVRNEMEICYSGSNYYNSKEYYTAYENETISEFANRNSIGNEFRTFIPLSAIDCMNSSGNGWGGERWYVDLNNCTYYSRNKIEVNLSYDTTLKSSSEGCYINNESFTIPSGTRSYPSSGSGTCLWAETEVIVYDSKKKKRLKKKIKDLTPDDLILAWDFDKGEFVFVKPLWIRKLDVADHYYLVKFSDGSELKIIHDHRVFNCQTNSFESGLEMKIGSTTINSLGQEVTLLSRNRIDEEINYSSVITDYHMNLFAGNILTSIKLNNLYSIKNMKFVKENRDDNEKNIFVNMDDKMFKGLRLSEQSLSEYYPLEDINEFVEGITQVNRI